MAVADLFPALRSVAHFVPLSARLATAGQPTAEQFAAVKAAGFESVINLAMPDSVGAIPDEDLLIEDLGLEYVPIPVRWLAPTQENLRAFFAAMDAREERRVFVHCIANKRVSAFLYLYRVLKKGIPEPEARADLLAVWTPNDVWQEFLDTVLSDANHTT